MGRAQRTQERRAVGVALAAVGLVGVLALMPAASAIPLIGWFHWDDVNGECNATHFGQLLKGPYTEHVDPVGSGADFNHNGIDCVGLVKRGR